MISLNDTMAADLWRAHVATRFEPKQCPSPSVTRPTPLPRFSLSSDDEENDSSELAYLCAEPAEERPDSPAPSLVSDSCCSSESGHSSFTTTFSEESHSGTFGRAFASSRSEAAFAYPGSKFPHPFSHPVLTINPGPRFMEFGSPSPVDSGYGGSRPATPFMDKIRDIKADDATWSPVDYSYSPAESVSSHCQLDAFSDVKQDAGAKTALFPDSQGPVTPRIVLFDEEGRVVDANFDEATSTIIPLGDDDIDSPYGGLMPITEHRCSEPVIPTPRPATNNKAKSSATGSVRDRAFVPYTRTHIVPSNTAPIYHNSHRAPTFVLDCLGEEEEEEAVERDILAIAVSILEEEEEKCEGMEVGVSCVETIVEVPIVSIVEDESVEALMDSYIGRSAVLEVADKFTISTLGSDEDDECEECGLFFTSPDEHYSRLTGTLDQTKVQPAIVFGLLKTSTRSSFKRELNTTYHVTEQGRCLNPSVASCTFDCERGYWAEFQGLSGVNFPRECPAHGGQGACAVGAIFHHPATISTASANNDKTLFDYAALAAELVGLLPKVEPILDEEDLDDEDLVLHSSEKMHPTKSKDAAPKTGAGYDDYMSRFMDDVDISSSSSAESLKNAPFGKLGGAFKDLRGGTVPEAVDHLKEGLEKTENVFRAAFATHFRLNSMTDKFVRGHKVQLSKEKLPVSESRQSMKESPASGMKSKWSNMLNKFTR